MSWKLSSVILLWLVVDHHHCHPSLPAINDASQDERPSAPVILDVNVIHEYEDSEPYNETFNFEKEVTNITLEDLDNERENMKYVPVSVQISYVVTPGKSKYSLPQILPLPQDYGTINVTYLKLCNHIERQVIGHDTANALTLKMCHGRLLVIFCGNQVVSEGYNAIHTQAINKRVWSLPIFITMYKH